MSIADWYEAGCRRSCSEQHTYIWGNCALAPESAKPEPTVSILRVRPDTDGGMGIVTESFTVTELADRIEQALHSVQITLGPKSLELIRDGHRMHLTGGEYRDLALAAAVDLAEDREAGR